MNLKISIALLLALIPALASASTRPATVHLRTQIYHDRTPKAHVHQSLPHHV